MADTDSTPKDSTSSSDADKAKTTTPAKSAATPDPTASAAPGGRSPDGESQAQGPNTGGDTLLEDTEVRATPQPATVVDATGIERIVHYPNDWTPAPVEPDEEAVARAEERNRIFAEQRASRGETFTDTARVGDTAQPAVDANAAEHG